MTRYFIFLALIMFFNLTLFAMESAHFDKNDFEFENCLGTLKTYPSMSTLSSVEEVFKQMEFEEQNEKADFKAVIDSLEKHGNKATFSAQGNFEGQYLLINFILRAIKNGQEIELNDLKMFKGSEEKSQIIFGMNLAPIYTNGEVSNLNLTGKPPLIRPFFDSSYKNKKVVVDESINKNSETKSLDLWKIAKDLMANK